jgi:hypothetical protein
VLCRDDCHDSDTGAVSHELREKTPYRHLAGFIERSDETGVVVQERHDRRTPGKGFSICTNRSPPISQFAREPTEQPDLTLPFLRTDDGTDMGQSL